MRILRLASCALALSPAFALNADYSWELEGRLGQDESEHGAESDRTSLSTTYYFDPVADGTGPHALAAFLDPATRVSMSVSRNEDTLPNGALGSEITDYAVSGQYLLPRSKWFVGGRYSQGDLDDGPFPPPVVSSSGSLTGHAVVAGKYLGGGATRLQVSLDRSVTDTEQRLSVCIPGCFTGISNVEVTADAIRLDVMHVAPIRAATYALSGGVSETDSDVAASLVFLPNPLLPPFPNQSVNLALPTARTYFVSAELFPIQKLGVRLGFTRFDGENLSGDAIDVEASWFFRRNLGVELTLFREDFDGDSSDGVALRAIGRF